MKMKRMLNIDKQYSRFHGQKAIDKFFAIHPEAMEWKETIEWMMKSGTQHFIDDHFADGTYNNEWSYSLWFEEDEGYTYIAVITREAEAEKATEAEEERNDKAMKKATKKEVYARHGIEFDGKYIVAPIFGKIPELLIDGNTKVGKTVWTWSMLPGTEMFHVNIGTEDNPDIMECKGTCPMDCDGCYGKTGRYNCDNVEKSMAIKTVLAHCALDFIKNCILAQVEYNHIEFLRIHAVGDFFSDDYIDMWKDIVKACPATRFWTYTKNPKAENAFDEFENANIVKSVIPGIGLNFGTCEYIISTYEALKAQGEQVYICRCGIDKNQHCNDCKGCSVNKHVLFIEHSTSYKAEKDPYYETLKAIIEAQEKPVW